MKSKISKYLDSIGAEVFPLTNPYEIARFKANETICVIYSGSKGISFSSKEAEKVYNAFIKKQKINISGTKRKSFDSEMRKRLLERDGNLCFYTRQELTDENISIEHLIPLSKGGKNNLDNLVLCTKEINQKMADKPLIEKLKIRDELLRNK